MPSPRAHLTEEELGEVVEEMALAPDVGIPLEDAKSTLRELDLPAEQLEATLEKVRERKAQEARALAQEAERKRQTRRKLLVIAAAIALFVTATGIWIMQSRQQTAQYAAVTATQPLLQEEGGQLKLSAKLMGATKGDTLPMSCSWKAPDGTLLHESTWRTKPVTHNTWETHCVMRQAPTHVNVEMRVDGRIVTQSSR